MTYTFDQAKQAATLIFNGYTANRKNIPRIVAELRRHALPVKDGTTARIMIAANMLEWDKTHKVGKK